MFSLVNVKGEAVSSEGIDTQMLLDMYYGGISESELLESMGLDLGDIEAILNEDAHTRAVAKEKADAATLDPDNISETGASDTELEIEETTDTAGSSMQRRVSVKKPKQYYISLRDFSGKVRMIEVIPSDISQVEFNSIIVDVTKSMFSTVIKDMEASLKSGVPHTIDWWRNHNVVLNAKLQDDSKESAEIQKFRTMFFKTKPAVGVTTSTRWVVNYNVSKPNVQESLGAPITLEVRHYNINTRTTDVQRIDIPVSALYNGIELFNLLKSHGLTPAFSIPRGTATSKLANMSSMRVKVDVKQPFANMSIRMIGDTATPAYVAPASTPSAPVVPRPDPVVYPVIPPISVPDPSLFDGFTDDQDDIPLPPVVDTETLDDTPIDTVVEEPLVDATPVTPVTSTTINPKHEAIKAFSGGTVEDFLLHLVDIGVNEDDVNDMCADYTFLNDQSETMDMSNLSDTVLDSIASKMKDVSNMPPVIQLDKAVKEANKKQCK
jgi:hypothetical protein